MTIQWGAVCRPKQGQTVSGDTYVVRDLDHAALVVSVIDGLGGGREAAEASQAAAEVVRGHPKIALDEIIRRSHLALRSTRGAVMSILHLEPARQHASYIGVGNIGIYVVSEVSIKPISKNGILGYRLPTLLQLDYTYNSGDTFVLYSDGISSRFSMDGKLDLSLSPQALADAILNQYGKSNDDATVVVVRAS